MHTHAVNFESETLITFLTIGNNNKILSDPSIRKGLKKKGITEKSVFKMLNHIWFGYRLSLFCFYFSLFHRNSVSSAISWHFMTTILIFYNNFMDFWNQVVNANDLFHWKYPILFTSKKKKIFSVLSIGLLEVISNIL